MLHFHNVFKSIKKTFFFSKKTWHTHTLLNSLLFHCLYTVLNLSKLKNYHNRNHNRTDLEDFAIFKNVAHSLEPCETPSNWASHQALNFVQRS